MSQPIESSPTIATRLALLSLLLSSSAHAAQAGATQWQPNELHGMFANAAAGVLVEDQIGGGELLVRAAGKAAGPATEWSTARFGAAGEAFPNYSSAALLAGLNRNVFSQHATSIGFGGFSTGGDVCPSIDVQGHLLLSERWYFLSVTVGEPAPSQPTPVYGVPGSTLRGLADPERAILSYYLEGSAGIEGSLVDATTLEQTWETLGMSNASTADLVGIDWGTGAISVDPSGTRSAWLTPVRDRFFFSFTSDWIAANPDFYPLDPTTNQPLFQDSATIYSMRWVQASAGPGWEWSAPEVAFSSQELFGANAATTELDALSVYWNEVEPVTSSTYRVVLSTTIASGSADQLLGFDRASMGTNPAVVAQPLKTLNGDPVTAKLGLRRGVGATDVDNVNGTCGSDPEAGTLNGTLAIPVARLDPSIPTLFGLSVYRGISAEGGGAPEDWLNVRVTGLELPYDHLDAVLHLKVGFLTPEQVSNLNYHPSQWFDLGFVPVYGEQETVNFRFPGDLSGMLNLPTPFPISIVGTLLPTDGSPAIGSTWVSALNY
ncbi:MAG: hypothetical protein GY711_10350 [bacterium]|nr:hypothetical protein [bacterium]